MDTLYHYCSTGTFFNIVNHKSIWLSSMLQSSDSLEGQLLERFVATLAANDTSGVDQRIINLTRLVMAKSGRPFHGLAFCVSAEPDLLGQWRGYAANGEGVALGFDAGGLSHMAGQVGPPFVAAPTLKKVVYGLGPNEEFLSSVYLSLRTAFAMLKTDALHAAIRGYVMGVSEAEMSISEQESFRWVQDQVLEATDWMKAELYTCKPIAFEQENEWRLVGVVHDDQLSECSFRPRGATIVPFVEVSLPNDLLIRDVVLGPRCPLPVDVVNAFLRKHGCKAKVRRSDVSYR